MDSSFDLAEFALITPELIVLGGALLLIVELDRPFHGLIQVSGRPLREALDHIGR